MPGRPTAYRSDGASTATPSRADAPVAFELAIRIYLRRCRLFGWLRNDSARHPEDVRAEFFKGVGVIRGLLQKAVHDLDQILDRFDLGVEHYGYAHSATSGKLRQDCTSAILPPCCVEFGAIFVTSPAYLRKISSSPIRPITMSFRHGVLSGSDGEPIRNSARSAAVYVA